MLAWLQQLYWREPLWLCLALQPALLLALRNLWRRQRLRAYAEPALQAWVIKIDHKPLLPRLFSRDTAYVIGWLLLAVAVAGPRLPLPSSTTQQTADINLMIVVDSSRSMAVSDVLPSRSRRARLEIDELLSQASGNRVGIITFAARPHLYVPLTSDYDALRNYLSILDELVLPTQGSRITAALAMANRELANTPGQRAVLLITDGDIGEMTDEQRQYLFGTARRLAEHDMPLYVLGMGSVEGDAIPLAGGGWLTADDRPVISRLNQDLLKELANMGNGRYSVAYDDNSDWQLLYTNGMAKLIESALTEQEQQDIQWQEFYAWFLLPGTLLLFIALYPYRFPSRLASLTSPMLVAIGFVLMLAHDQASAADTTRIEQRAYLLYQQGEYSEAARQYERLDSFAGRLGEGASLYRQGDYAAAIRQYSAAVLYAGSDNERAIALYNLGNSYFRTGDYATAITVYRDALHYQPDYTQAQHNLSFSLAVQEEVGKRLRESIIADRAGSGPRSARAREGLDLSAGSGVSLDGSDDSDKAPLPPGIPGEIDRSAVEALIQRGLEHIQLAGGPTDLTDAATAAAPVTGQADMHLLTQAQDRPAQLWKRVFELEEGFPAELEAPVPVDGVAPW